jgi:glycosyltransferase involved in cell wall biosynthesis
MKLLILTQKVDREDDVLGFFHEWLKRFSAQCEAVEVICLYEGAHDLPGNVRVYSLGKEKGSGRLRRLLRLYAYLWQLRGRYDAVFVHMNPEYLALAGWWWKLSGKPAVLWYSHRNVDLKLRVAVLFATAVASSAASSFRLATPKLRVLGHGVDTGLFAPRASPAERTGRWRLVSVGRLTPIKRLETAIEALALLRQGGIDAELTLVGQATASGDQAYEQKLRAQVRALNLDSYVHFAGPVPYGRICEIYKVSDASINLAPTGGLDKAVLESMATGLPTFLSNEGFAELVGPYKPRLMFAQDNARDLADKLAAVYHAGDGAAAGAFLREQVINHAGLDALIKNLLSLLCPSK